MSLPEMQALGRSTIRTGVSPSRQVATVCMLHAQASYVWAIDRKRSVLRTLFYRCAHHRLKIYCIAKFLRSNTKLRMRSAYVLPKVLLHLVMLAPYQEVPTTSSMPFAIGMTTSKTHASSADSIFLEALANQRLFLHLLSFSFYRRSLRQDQHRHALV